MKASAQFKYLSVLGLTLFLLGFLLGPIYADQQSASSNDESDVKAPMQQNFPSNLNKTKQFINNNENNMPQKEDELRNQLMERRGKVKEEVQERLKQVKLRVIKLVKNKGKRMLRRYRAAVTRFEKILARIDSRIKKLKAKGVDTSTAEKELATIRVKVENVKKSLDLASATIDSLSENTQAGAVKSVVLGVVSTLKEEKANLIDLYQSLRNVVRELKSSERMEVGNAQQ